MEWSRGPRTADWTGNTADEIFEFTEGVEEGATVVIEAGSQLDDIVSNSARLKDRHETLTDSMNEHSSAVDELAETMDSISGSVDPLRDEADELLTVE